MKYYASDILLKEGWAQDKTIDVNDGIITAIYSGKQPDSENFAGPVIPGMVNLHSHAFQKAFVGLTEVMRDPNDSFWSWRDSMYRLLQVLTPDDLGIIAQYLYSEMLLQGYTSCAEFHYLHHQADGQPYDELSTNSVQLVEAAKQTGIALCLCPVYYNHSNFGDAEPSKAQKTFVNSFDQFQRLMEDLLNQYHNEKDISFGVAPHSLRAVSIGGLQQLTQWWNGRSPGSPIHIHIAEQIKEVNECLHFHQQRPVELLMNNLPVNERWCLVHATHLDEKEIRLIGASKAVAGICPSTEANLGDGLFPALAYLKENGVWGIGSDSHISVSPWQELRLFEYGQRLNHQRRNLLCQTTLPHVGTYLWNQSCQGGAQVINRRSGVLDIGFKADLVVLDREISELSSLPADYLLDSAVFALNTNPVRDVMVGGCWQVRNGLHQQHDLIQRQYQAFLKQKVHPSL